jgi:BirA family transcriptional regulator, biotin operon repressor / biotin---[acetyl-CoA-carboxylase] ligase
MISFMKPYELAFKTLEILSDGAFHSGEKIAQQMGCSRVSVWKAISQLKEIGVEVFSVRNKGYRVPSSFFILNEKQIHQELGEIAQFINFELIHVIESTNSYLMQRANEKPHATVVAANFQTKGKGRRGRIWQSHLGESLVMSILWKFSKGASQLSGLSLVIGIALQRTMQKIGISNSFLKWPNDLLVKVEDAYYKIAGVLIELQGDMESRSSAVIGIGLNYQLSERLRKKIDQPAMGIKVLLDQEFNLNQIVAILIREIINILSDFDQKDFSSFKAEWLAYHAFDKQQISFLKANGESVMGQVFDLGADGSLVIKKDNGDRESLLSGEVSQIK